ncbi:MAG: hypothetical protein IIZ17_02360 [Eubacteriaceae bacterium]|nr:hypothetical protein [Eubacteriaceae bacterium]MCR4893951.1 hypothetical protein [Eubacteriales bacterium]
MVKRKLLFLLCLIAAFSFTSCAFPAGSSSPEEYMLGEELCVTMSSGFKASEDMPGADVYLSKGDECALYAVRDTAETLGGYGYDPDGIDLAAYFDLVCAANGISPEPSDGSQEPYAVFRRTAGETEYWYYVTVRECPGAFWTVYLISPVREGEESAPQTLSDYGSSIRVM